MIVFFECNNPNEKDVIFCKEVNLDPNSEELLFDYVLHHILKAVCRSEKAVDIRIIDKGWTMNGRYHVLYHLIRKPIGDREINIDDEVAKLYFTNVGKYVTSAIPSKGE